MQQLSDNGQLDARSCVSSPSAPPRIHSIHYLTKQVSVTIPDQSPDTICYYLWFVHTDSFHSFWYGSGWISFSILTYHWLDEFPKKYLVFRLIFRTAEVPLLLVWYVNDRYLLGTTCNEICLAQNASTLDWIHSSSPLSNYWSHPHSTMLTPLHYPPPTVLSANIPTPFTPIFS